MPASLPGVIFMRDLLRASRFVGVPSDTPWIASAGAKSTIGNLNSSKAAAQQPARRGPPHQVPLPRLPLRLDARRRGISRREQRAAILVRNHGRAVRADPLRVGRDFFLVKTDERPQERQRHHLTDRGELSIVCEATCPTESPLTSACACVRRARRSAIRIMSRR
jgi:hypothetical protein